jgi:hypothetical protein
MNQNKINNLIGLAGSFLMIIAVFCPVVKVPFGGSISFISNWEFAGTIVVIFGLGAGVISFFGKGRYLWFPAFWLLLIISYQLYTFHKNVDQYSFGNRFLRLNLNSNFPLEWGWLLLFGAVGLLLLSSILCHKK